MGFVRCPYDPCLYQKTVSIPGTNEFYTLLLCVHVDDGLLINNHRPMIVASTREFRTYVKKVSIVEPVKRFLGIYRFQR